jgi:hypothetical protein
MMFMMHHFIPNKSYDAFTSVQIEVWLCTEIVLKTVKCQPANQKL